MSRDVRRRLEDAGRQPVPDVDPAFAEALEARLLAVAASRALRRPSRHAVAGPSLWVRLAASGATLAVAALVIALVVAGTRPPADDATLVALELVAPVNVEVALADGTTLEDPDGLFLPEGTVIVVGDGGSARIGETVLRPGDIATVEHGDVRVEHRGAVGSVTATPRPRRRRGHRLALAGRDASARPARRRPDPTGRRGRRRPPATPAPTSAARRRRRPPRRLTERPRRPTVAPPPTPTPTPAILRPRLRARLIDGPRIAVSWTATYRARSYVADRDRARRRARAGPRLPRVARHRHVRPPAGPPAAVPGARRGARDAAPGDRAARGRLGPAPEQHRHDHDPAGGHAGVQHVAGRDAARPTARRRRPLRPRP